MNVNVAKFASSKPMIMVVEDRTELLSDEVSAYKDHGCSVFGFHSANEALECIYSTPSIDLILTDLDLEGSGHDKSGISLAKSIRNITSDIIVRTDKS